MDYGYMVIVGVVSFAAGVLVQDTAQEYERMRKKPVQARIEPAPIWSLRCERVRGLMVATQSDGREWKVRCYRPGRS